MMSLFGCSGSLQHHLSSAEMQNLLNKNNVCQLLGLFTLSSSGKCQKSPRAMQKGETFLCYGPGRNRPHLA